MSACGPVGGVFALLTAGDGGGLLSVGVVCGGGEADVCIPSVDMVDFFFLFLFFGGFPVISRRLAGDNAPFGDRIFDE